ncbi:MAG: 16S rRNA (guanine(527)-N(7))-methyltransferase RsmG [Steroidobacteraceae bacterium]
MSELTAPLHSGAAALGVPLAAAQLAQFATLVQELVRWNKAYNLTAITEPAEILTHHLLDSLAAQPDLAGITVADVGTGAGFPGLPLAIVNPQRQFTLIDAVDKKLRFIDHAARELGLDNVRTLHGRVEQLKLAKAFDTVITRAFAPLPRLAGWVAPLCDAHTCVVAMKGRWPPPAPASESSDADGGVLPGGWRIESLRPVVVPGLSEERNIVILRRDGSPGIP